MMNAQLKHRTVWGLVVGISLCMADWSLGNGGPFVVKYPNGDPAAKGILARLDASLKPAREERLRVVNEDLKITFVSDHRPRPTKQKSAPPLALVSAEYTIENPTSEEIEIDFGFPILRGIYLSPFSMRAKPDVQVRLNNKKPVGVNIISNSAIYGLIRRQAREVIERAIRQDATLARLVATVRATGMVRRRARKTVKEAIGGDAALAAAVAKDPLLAGLLAGTSDVVEPDHTEARAALAKYLTGPMTWNERDVALLVEFASVDFGTLRARPPDRGLIFFRTIGNQLANANLGPIAAIGEQKATQFLARLAACFDPNVAATYESIFTAWGGDVRERSVDLKTGHVRPREVSVDPNGLSRTNPLYAMSGDLTVYARVNYMDPTAKISEAEKASCKAVLKNLPVIFTFAPMNLLHYRVKFPARSTQTLTVSYAQYAYKDTREPASYQLAYVVHPASMWKEFGPIHLEVATPEGVPFRASMPCRSTGVEQREPDAGRWFGRRKGKLPFATHQATLTTKTGEIFLALDAKAWDEMSRKEAGERRTQRQARR